MALELIKSDRTIQALKPGIKRLSDGGGLYLLPFAKGDAHYWRFDYTFEGKRKNLSLGVYPATGLALAREKAVTARSTVAAGQDPSNERRQQRVVTHHYPHTNSCAPQWANDPVSSIFGSKIPNEVLLGAKLWIHGHTHDSSDYRIGDSTRSKSRQKKISKK